MPNNQLEQLSDKVVNSLISTNNEELMDLVINKLQKQLKSKDATVYYAGDLTSVQKNHLSKSIKQKFADSLNINFIKDESLISGIKITYQDYVYDDSLVAKFKKIHGT